MIQSIRVGHRTTRPIGAHRTKCRCPRRNGTAYILSIRSARCRECRVRPHRRVRSNLRRSGFGATVQLPGRSHCNRRSRPVRPRIDGCGGPAARLAAWERLNVEPSVRDHVIQGAFLHPHAVRDLRERERQWLRHGSVVRQNLPSGQCTFLRLRRFAQTLFVAQTANGELRWNGATRSQ